MKYQYKEIGKGDWTDCTKEWYDYCNQSPEHDTKILTFDEVKSRVKQMSK